MNKLPALAFLTLGVLWFLMATRWLSVTSEGALMTGAIGLVPGVCGAIAALIARARTGRSIVVGLATGVGSAVALVVFFQSIWPML